MKRRLMWMQFIMCALCILTGTWVASAQEVKPPAPEKAPQPPADVMFERDIMISVPPGQAGVPAPPSPPARQAVVARGGEEMTFAFISAEMSFDGKVVKGAPYSAEALSESTQVLADGNKITRKSSTKIYRDSEGRTRRDQELGAVGPFAMMGDPPQTTLINDPVAGVNYMLDARSRIARKNPFPPNFGTFPRAPLPPGLPGELPPPPGDVPMVAPMRFNKGLPPPDDVLRRVEPVYPPIAKAAGVQGFVRVAFNVNEAGEVESAEAIEGHPLLQQAAVDAIKQWRFKPTAVSGAAVKVKGRMVFNFFLPREEGGNTLKAVIAPHASEWENESLGKQTVEGIEAEGTRSTMTIPANAIGNERPIKVLTERWYSPELQTVVMVKRQDPRFGETVYRLTNINRAEPARELFEVPTDYTVKDGAPMKFRIMKDTKE